eukprot:m51a1_g14291 hypothetical protein (407) ;mRNA; r:405458-406932
MRGECLLRRQASALALAQHPRLGDRSPASLLDASLLQQVCAGLVRSCLPAVLVASALAPSRPPADASCALGLRIVRPGAPGADLDTAALDMCAGHVVSAALAAHSDDVAVVVVRRSAAAGSMRVWFDTLCCYDARAGSLVTSMSFRCTSRDFRSHTRAAVSCSPSPRVAVLSSSDSSPGLLSVVSLQPGPALGAVQRAVVRECPVFPLEVAWLSPSEVAVQSIRAMQGDDSLDISVGVLSPATGGLVRSHTVRTSCGMTRVRVVHGRALAQASPRTWASQELTDGGAASSLDSTVAPTALDGCRALGMLDGVPVAYEMPPGREPSRVRVPGSVCAALKLNWSPGVWVAATRGAGAGFCLRFVDEVSEEVVYECAVGDHEPLALLPRGSGSCVVDKTRIQAAWSHST